MQRQMISGLQDPDTLGPILSSSPPTTASLPGAPVTAARITVAAIQMQSTEDKQRNLRVASELIQEAAARKAKVIFLPDCVDFLASSSRHVNVASTPDESRTAPNWEDIAESWDGPTLRTFQKLAEHFQVYLSLGGIHHKSSGDEECRVHNSHVIINSVGRVVASYPKLHLPLPPSNLISPMLPMPPSLHSISAEAEVAEGSSPSSTGNHLADPEMLHSSSGSSMADSGHNLHQGSLQLARGNKVIPPVETPAGLVGLADGHDLRFPEMSVCLREMGAEILAFPAAFPRNYGKTQWEVLLRSRAIENNCYVVAAAQCGHHHSPWAGYGHSMIIDPTGNILSQCEDERAAVLFAHIELDQIGNLNFCRRRDIFSLVLGVGQPVDIGKEDYHFRGHVIDNSIVFYRSMYSFAFVNLTPHLGSYVLVCPLEERHNFHELRQEQVSDLFLSVQQIVNELQKEHRNTHFDICLGTNQPVCIQLHMRKDPFQRNVSTFNNYAFNVASNSIVDSRTRRHNFFHSEADVVEEALTLRKLFYR